jgi:hypothetical protein
MADETAEAIGPLTTMTLWLLSNIKYVNPWRKEENNAGWSKGLGPYCS